MPNSAIIFSCIHTASCTFVTRPILIDQLLYIEITLCKEGVSILFITVSATTNGTTTQVVRRKRLSLNLKE